VHLVFIIRPCYVTYECVVDFRFVNIVLLLQYLVVVTVVVVLGCPGLQGSTYELVNEHTFRVLPVLFNLISFLPIIFSSSATKEYCAAETASMFPRPLWLAVFLLILV